MSTLKERDLILAARVISMLFTPFYLPLVAMIALFTFSYLRYFPLGYKLQVVLMVYLFTILLPTFIIHLYRRYQGWTPLQLGTKERRMIPYVISIMCYLACYYIMSLLHIPHFMGRILVAALMVQVICAVINIWWKISTHTAAIGGLAGGLVAFAHIFSFNPLWWLCLIIFLAGLLGSSRMFLRQHSLPQVVTGFFVGFMTAWISMI
jgi:membrane-associated phospholipid phosphatase